ncbi:MAG: prepilin-type N-terminal cleavage/methylation domain-containing protein [Nitrospiraceae bacterium]
MGSRLRHEKGFSLTETMVAAGILAVGLLALSGMQIISLNKNVDANDLTIANNMAGEMMERIQFNRFRAGNVPSPYNAIDTLNNGTAPNAGTEPQANGDYTQWVAELAASGLRNPQGLVTVQPIVTVPSLNQYQVQVRVNWQERGGAGAAGQNRNVTVVSVLAFE